MKHRSLSLYAQDIIFTWKKISPHAAPYVQAMLELDQIEDMYYLDPASEIVLRFLCNAQGYRGETAKRLKAELKQILKQCDERLASQNHRSRYETR